MTTVLAISPHLDDAVFSAGGTLAGLAGAGARVVVLTCFTGSTPDPGGFALACQLDKGLAADVDYMAMRRVEDRTACTAIGAEAIHLPHLEAPHRGYDSAAALFAAVRPDDGIDDTLAADIAAVIYRLQPDLVLGPLAIGGHVDHVQVRRALVQALDGRSPVLWADQPYAMRTPAMRDGLCAHRLAPTDVAARAAGVLAYTTQIGFQFGGVAAARAALADCPCEYFDRLLPDFAERLDG